jgi:hypothetical protein
LEVELLVSDIPDDSRRAENRVKLGLGSQVPYTLNSYIASAEYIVDTAYPVGEQHVTYVAFWMVRRQGVHVFTKPFFFK